jgi:hypothetical protein
MHRPLLPLHHGQTLAAEHDEPLLGRLGVVVAEVLPGLQDVDVNTNVGLMTRPLFPVKIARHAEARNRGPRISPRLRMNQPSPAGRRPCSVSWIGASCTCGSPGTARADSTPQHANARL